MKIGCTDKKHLRHCFSIPALQTESSPLNSVSTKKQIQYAHYLISVELSGGAGDFSTNLPVHIE